MKVPMICLAAAEGQPDLPSVGQPCGSKVFTREVAGTYNDTERVHFDSTALEVVDSQDEPNYFGEWTCSEGHVQAEDVTWREL